MVRKGSIIFLAIVFISLAWWMVAFSGFRFLAFYDWDTFLTYHELERTAIQEYRQFPLWNPYLCGGEPWWAHTDSDFLSPFFIFVLMFGAVKGTICIYLLQVITALTGMYFLARYYGLSRILGLLSCLFFLHSFNFITFAGCSSFLNISILPWVYLFFKKSLRDKKYRFIVALLFSYLLYAGWYFILIFSFIIIAVEIIFSMLNEKKPALLFYPFGILITAFFLASPKILPMAELIMQYPRIITLPPVASLFSLENVAVSIKELKYVFYSLQNIYISSMFVNEEMFGYFLSIPVIILLVASPFLLWKKYKTLVLMNVVFLFLALGDACPINLWRIFHFFAPSIQHCAAFFVPLFVMLSLALALVIKELRNIFNLRPKLILIISLFFALTVSLDVLIGANMIFKTDRESLQYNFRNKKTSFMQTKGDPWKMFDTIFNGQGAVYGYDNIGSQIKTKVVPRESPGYRGEYFLLNGRGRVRETFFSPNKLVFNLDVQGKDILIINQNYFRGWRSSAGEVLNSGGLIGIPVAEKDKEVTVYYLPDSLVVGIVIFAGFCLFSIYRKTKYRL